MDMKETYEHQKNQKPAEAEENNRKEKADAPEAEKDQAAGGEVSPKADSKKEEISGYNEHPDQTKVGGG